jgi:iron complex outermembrane receptor protein
MQKFLLLSFFTLISISHSFSQFNIVGFVTSEEDGEPLFGVNIKVKGGDTGTITDFDGKYEIEATADATLIFSYIGFKTQEVPVNGRQIIDITLGSDAEQLGEVVVTALGIKRQKRELGYSAETFDGEGLEKSNAANLVSALSGKSAGVQIAGANGVDGGTTRITIRGNNNLKGNNQPLIIVDGVPLENESGLDDIGRGVDWGSAINNINPQDIENMNILKGPTASALYGSRGANGVIIITTKRGKKQKGIGINYNLSHKIIQPFRYREVQNVYGSGGPVSLTSPELQMNDEGEYSYPNQIHTNNGPFGKSTTELFGFYSTGVSWGPKMDGQMVRWWDGELREYTPQPDNLSLFFKNGHTTSNNVSFSGGGKMGTMRVSLTHQGHEAVIPNSNFTQLTANIGSRLDISSRVHADISLSYVQFNRLNSPTLGDDNNASFGKGILYSWPRSYKGLEKDINILPDGTRNDYGGNYPFSFAPPHLWWNAQNNNTELDRNKLIGALSLTYDVTNWLNVTGRFGLDFTLTQFERRNKPYDNLGILGGSYSNELDRNKVINNEVLITLHKEEFLDSPLGVTFSMGGTQWERSRYAIRGNSAKWINPWLYTFNNYENRIDVPIPSEVRFDKKINSIYSFLNLKYKDFLFLEIAGRNDWSSALPIQNNSYFYPSASLSFILSEVVDFKQSWISFFKLRAAYAETATDTDPFALDFTYSTGSFSGSQTASLPTTIPPLELKPQLANSYEAGLSLGLFQDKVQFDFTYYQIWSFAQILDSPLPSSSGANNIKINTGEIQNQGVEATLNITLIQKPNFYWETGFNVSRNRNKIISLGEGADILPLASIWGLNGPGISVREGEEYGTIIGYDYLYHEDNGQPILNEEGTHYLFTENRVPIGNAAPKFTGGWSMRMGYKGFSLSTLVDTKWGGDMYAGSYVIGLQTGQSPETLIERQGGGLPYTDPEGNTSNIGVVLDGVYADGTPNDKVVHYYFKYVPNAGGWGHFLSTPGILENTWVKLREVSLSYKFPEKLLSNSRIFQNLSASVVGRDLFYIYTTLPDNINPEGYNGSGNAQGLEWASYPGMRSFSFSLKASF